MNTLAKYKGLLITLVVLALLFFVYNTYVKSLIFTADQSVTAQDVGADLVKIYADLSAVSFKSDLFKTASYRALQDFSTPLQALPVGRAHPFDAIGKD
jgi:hypothetical protein